MSDEMKPDVPRRHGSPDPVRFESSRSPREFEIESPWDTWQRLIGCLPPKKREIIKRFLAGHAPVTEAESQLFRDAMAHLEDLMQKPPNSVS